MMYEHNYTPNVKAMLTPTGQSVRIVDYPTLRYGIQQLIDIDRENARIDADGTITIQWRDQRNQLTYSSYDWHNGILIGKYLESGDWALLGPDRIATFKPYSEEVEPPKDPRHVTVFLADGNTLRFDNVTMIEDGKEQVEYKNPFTFSYVSQSDGKLKIGIINLNNQNIVGYSVYDPETEEVLLNNSEEEETNESK